MSGHMLLKERLEKDIVAAVTQGCQEILFTGSQILTARALSSL